MTVAAPINKPLLGSPCHWSVGYVGIPFLDNGHSASGCHCWGLVHLVLKQERGIDVPTYGEISAIELAKVAKTMARDQFNKPWIKVTEPREFDVALMYAMEGGHRLLGHAGIMTSPTTVLHVWAATDAVNMSIDHPRVRYRLVGFYRHEALQ